ncbi:MAG: hypothetical protein Q8K78_19465 [Planctomycetaceae bacterium]|nr:hypothetical protein [Planctomycetaceae bacterium]
MFDRRQFLHTTLSTATAALLAPQFLIGAEKPSLKLASFRVDVSPPMDHPLCGGWIKSVVGVDDAEEAIGLVITGVGDPIVIVAVDWTGILNQAHQRWRQVLAQAAGTTPDRVAVQCVHQHNAPFVCLEAEKIVTAQDGLPHTVFVDFFEKSLEQTAKAVTDAMKRLRPVTHIATGQAKVEKVASNRRFLNDKGIVSDWRGSASKNPVHWELPEGLIDPWLKTVAFYDGETKLAACHYYATHPMSYYGDGKVCSDFVGLARKRRQAEEPECAHIYFTGCSGNIAAGKYNNGTPEARVQLTDRIYAGIVGSEQQLMKQPIETVAWQTENILFTPRAALNETTLMEQVRNKDAALANRIRPAMSLGWLRRCERKEPIVLSALHINSTTLLHLPAESFVEYQLRAQAAAPQRFVATAAYGDGGPWYIPVAEAYPQGGYEVSVALSEPTADATMTAGLTKLAMAKG